jgi:transcriptional regulator with XRE-family HTH domain
MNALYGERIRSERKRLKLTQTAFAKAVGVSQTTQVGYETGAHLPNVHYLATAATLGVDILYVVLGKQASLAAIDFIHWDTYIRIVEAIDEWLDRNLLTVDTPKKLRLARLLLHKFSGQEVIRPDDIAEHLKLVA